jgi:hypothetical protein
MITACKIKSTESRLLPRNITSTTSTATVRRHHVSHMNGHCIHCHVFVHNAQRISLGAVRLSALPLLSSLPRAPRASSSPLRAEHGSHEVGPCLRREVVRSAVEETRRRRVVIWFQCDILTLHMHRHTHTHTRTRARTHTHTHTHVRARTHTRTHSNNVLLTFLRLVCLPSSVCLLVPPL